MTRQKAPCRATFVAPSNIAFIKYWGVQDEARVLPTNPSISMTLSGCTSKCTVEFDPQGTGAEIHLGDGAGCFSAASEAFAAPVERQLERLRVRAERPGGFRVWTENTFPTGAGIASSASGFAALTLAATHALGSPPTDVGEASLLARLSGSGSAARSVLGGYVLWPRDSTPANPADLRAGEAIQIAPPEHWKLCDVVAVVDARQKSVSSREGHRRAPSSPRFASRLEDLRGRLETVRTAIRDRDIEALGETVETEAIDLHLVAMSSRPPIYYWTEGTFAVLWAIRAMRREGIPVYATIDAGPNVHAICPSEDAMRVAEAFETMPEVESVLSDEVGSGPHAIDEHLGESDR